VAAEGETVMARDSEDFEPIEIDGVTAIHETEQALLVEYEGDEFWLPKSQIHDDSEVYERETKGKLVIPRWLAIEKGFIDG
jgi:hypothetical protein